MKINKKHKVEKDYEDIFSFNNSTDKVNHDAKMIMFRFLSEIEKVWVSKNGKDVKKKELAELIKMSPSYITQLYNGDKLVNLNTLAKFQEALNIDFNIEAVPNYNIFQDDINNYSSCLRVVKGLSSLPIKDIEANDIQDYSLKIAN